MKAKYVNPFTDFGFKKLFGEEASKPLLMDFLNSLLPESKQIANLSFKNTEQLGIVNYERKAIFDIYCESENGEKFIVELQKAKQNYFIERTIYYSTFPIREQAEKGDWDFNLKAVYCIGILDFAFAESENKEVVHTIQLKNQNGNVFYDKLTYIYLEMPNFKLEETELKSRLEKWLYFIKYLEDFTVIPSIFKDETIFNLGFKSAELANYNQTELDKYEYSLKAFRDNKNTLDYATESAFGEGKLEGKMEEKYTVIKNGINAGFPLDVLSQLTGLTIEEIEEYLNSKN